MDNQENLVSVSFVGCFQICEFSVSVVCMRVVVRPCSRFCVMRVGVGVCYRGGWCVLCV